MLHFSYSCENYNDLKTLGFKSVPNVNTAYICYWCHEMDYHMTEFSAKHILLHFEHLVQHGESCWSAVMVITMSKSRRVWTRARTKSNTWSLLEFKLFKLITLLLKAVWCWLVEVSKAKLEYLRNVTYKITIQ